MSTTDDAKSCLAVYVQLMSILVSTPTSRAVGSWLIKITLFLGMGAFQVMHEFPLSQLDASGTQQHPEGKSYVASVSS